MTAENRLCNMIIARLSEDPMTSVIYNEYKEIQRNEYRDVILEACSLFIRAQYTTWRGLPIRMVLDIVDSCAYPT